MWTCPICKRTFKRTNQGHYCGNAPVSVEEYIERQPEEIHAFLHGIRSLFLSIPDLQEGMSWSMPTYKKSNLSVSFAACKKHVSLYLGIDTLEAFSTELSEYETHKNAIYIPYDKPIPENLIIKMIQYRFD